MALRKPAIASGTVGAAGALRRSGGETAWRRLLHLRGALRRVRGAVGILCLVAAMLLTPAVDGVAKVMADTNGPATISFLRYLAAGLLGLAVARGLGRPIAVPRGDRLGLVVRTGLIMGAMTALIAALARVPMAEAVGGFLIAPVVSGLLGLCFWGERLTLPRLGGMAVSLIGAVTLARPQAGLSQGALLALFGGGLLGLYLAATRGARTTTDALSTLTVQSLLGACLLLPLACFEELPRPGLPLLGGAVALGTISAICHGLTVAAYQRTEAIRLAPFCYFNMLTAAAVGFVCFGERPDLTGWIGLAGIAAGGLVTLIPGPTLAFNLRRPRTRRRSASPDGCGPPSAYPPARCVPST